MHPSRPARPSSFVPGRIPPLFTLGAVLVLSALALALPGCGLEGAARPTGFRITATTVERLPSEGEDGGASGLYASGEDVTWEVPLAGGCGGPYTVRVVAGALPPGIAVVEEPDGTLVPGGAPHLDGVLLADGQFTFRLEVLDRGCVPFRHAWADLTWIVPRGAVRIVAAEPSFRWPDADDTDEASTPPPSPGLPALADTVYGRFAVHRFVVAGGVPPYALELIDDPTTPEDGPLPIGTGIPRASTALLGAPIQIRGDGRPFRLTLRASDATGETGAPLSVLWHVVAPPLAFVTQGFPDGRCGAPYTASLEILGGVPPFRFDLVRSDAARGADGAPLVVWRAPEPPLLEPPSALARLDAGDYPSADEIGPDYREFHTPPEGLCLGDVPSSPFAGLGALSGIPRRRGTFRLIAHVASALVPNLPGQQDWRAIDLSVTACDATFAQDPAYTVEGAFRTSEPHAAIPEAEAGVGYNPDASLHPPAGLKLRATGGVRKDGRTDAPHASQVTSIEGMGAAQEDASTPGGGYDWTVAPVPDDGGASGSALPPGMALDGWVGVWRAATPSLLTAGRPRTLRFTAYDQQLPLAIRNVASEQVRFAVGPDKVVITESTTPGLSTVGASGWDRNDNLQSVRVCLPYAAAAPVVRDLTAKDLSPTHVVPTATGLTGDSALAALLAKQDLLRVAVNPSGWWDDVHGLNPLAARPGQHADRNAYDHYLTGEVDTDATKDASRQPSATAVALPACRAGAFAAVTHDPARGVYADGGRLYAFQNDAWFGVFVVRSDASIYVPFAFSTTRAVNGRTYAGFGDGVAIAHAATGRSQLRIAHLAVSPDGRFAAMKVKTRATDVLETADSTPIVLFSLAGERCFGEGEAASTWSLVATGAGGVTSTGVYLYGPSLVLTNSHLYALCGNLAGTGNVEVPSRSHFVYRFRFADPTTGNPTASETGTATLLPAADPAETQWTNAPGAPLQTRYQVFANPLVAGATGAFALAMDGMNLVENALAPLPFRVSADGRAVAILALADQTKAGPLRQAWHVWVDFEGRGARRLSTDPRHVTGGATRGYTLGRGDRDATYENWHRFGGPTPQMEISDDASLVAVVVNRFPGTPTFTSPTTSWPRDREDVIAYRTADQETWTEIPVTGDGAGRNVFSSARGALWRFGSLVFTKDGRGLVFWGGASSYNATAASATAQYSHLLAGTLYGADLSLAEDLDDVTVTSLLPAAEGGAAVGIQTFTASAPYDPAFPVQAYTAIAGVVKPYGGFLSSNREFLYLVNKGGLAPGSAEYRLVGVNVRSVDPTRSVGGHPDLRAFAVPAWPARRGFLSGTYGTNAQYGLYDTDYPAWRRWGMGLQVAAARTGWVYWGSQHQTTGPATGTATSVSGGPLYPTWSNDYAAYGGEIEGFDADIGGPVVRLSDFAADTAIRRIHFLEPSYDGTSVAFVLDTFGPTNASAAHEELHALSGVGLDEEGALVGAPSRRAVETSLRRISDAVAFGYDGSRLYFGAGEATDEATQVLKEARFPLPGASGTPTVRTLSAAPRRYNVLFAGR